MLGFLARSDNLNVTLFEFLDDDMKLAQSCMNWLYVQHWYVVVPDPAMRVTLAALMGIGKDCDKHTPDTPPRSVCWVCLSCCLSKPGRDQRKSSRFSFEWGSTWLCLGLCCQTGPVFSVSPRHHQQRLLPWSWSFSLGHGGGQRDAGQHKFFLNRVATARHIFSGRSSLSSFGFLCHCVSRQSRRLEGRSVSFIRHKSKQTPLEWMEAPPTTPSIR